MNPGFEITVCSDRDYEDLIIEIYFEDQLLVLINQEKGLDALEIDLYPGKGGGPWHFKLQELEEVVEAAKRKLRNLRGRATKLN